MDTIFENYRPDIVYHAAAYKNVPIIEKSPYEGIFVNVLELELLLIPPYVMAQSDSSW